MRRFTAIFVKRDKNSDLSSSSSTNSDHSSPPPWRSWIGAKRSSQKLPPQPIVLVHHDIDEDSLSEEEDDEDEYDQSNIRTRIQNALAVNPLPNSPFVHHPDQPIFPRSTNNADTLKSQSSTRIAMFNSHLLARLNSGPLSPSELSTILPFASKSAPSLIIHPILPFSDIARPTISSHVASASLGIQRWITRPCFEDRFAVYTPTDTTVQCRPVTSSMAIAALEYPEYLDVMADPEFDLSSPNSEKNVCDPPPVDTAAMQSHAFPPEFSATSGILHIPFILILDSHIIIFQVTPVHWRNSSTVVPSPLRIQHSPPSTKKDKPAVASPASKTTVKRIVRFAEEDDDDGIPLHMVRMKKKREEKANFLRLEQLKRAMEEDEERKRQEQEALEKERRRLAKEKERREADKALYAETIAAARLRREGHRVGTILPSNTTNSSTSSSSASLRNSERNKLTDSRRLSSKPPFDPSLSIPRRDDSDPAYYHHQSDSSPGSSRSPSVNHSNMSPNHLSPPPSMYSTRTSSSEEVRQHRSSKRNSVTPPAAAAAVGNTSSPYHRPPIASYPTWSSSSQTLPQVRPFPDLGHDMPLLPPTAPFMKYNRGSKGSSPPSTSSSRRGSFNSSNELVNQLLPPQTTRSSSRHLSSTAVPPPSRTKPERRPTNERRSSGDSTALSLHSTQHQQRPSPSSSKSQPTVSRGRPSLPAQFLQTPSVWPGLPSQNGLMPMPMAMGYSPMNAYPVMFYPTGPMPTLQSVQMGSGGAGGGGNGNAWRELVS